MRAFVVFCLLAVATADVGYNYGQAGHGLSAPVSYNAVPQADYHKEFYTFYANEADFDDQAAARQLAGAIKKSVRVIFIKAPENRGYEHAVLALAKQAAEQQTAIYVLNKQPDIAELASKFNAIRSSQPSRPEVHFVKYRTADDAANAQRSIQSQYEQLGGSSQSINGGVANALNFVSGAKVAHVRPNSNYLPASILARLRLRTRRR